MIGWPKNSSGKEALFGFAFFGLVLIGYHFFAYSGYHGIDDLWYAGLANDLSRGDLTMGDDHIAYRWTIVGLTALAYYLFGVNDFASGLFPILTFVATRILVYKITDGGRVYQKLIAVSLVCLSPWNMFYSDKIMPDVYIAFSVLASVSAIYYHRYSDKKQDLKYACLFTVALLFGFFTKGSIVLILPVFAAIFISDILQVKHLKFWALSAIFLLGVMTAYGLHLQETTGSFLARLEAIDANYYINRCSYDILPWSVLLKRLTYEMPMVFIIHTMAVGMVMAIPYLIRRRVKEILKIESKQGFWCLILVGSFLSAIYMTISIKSYVPMCSDLRQFLYLVPFTAICAAPIFYDVLVEKKNTLFAIIGFSVVGVIAVLCESDAGYRTYFPLAALFGLRAVVDRKTLVLGVPAFLCAFTVLLTVELLISANFGASVKYRLQKSLIEDNLTYSNAPKILITNGLQKSLAKYYTGFNTQGKIRFLTFEEAESAEVDPEAQVYLMLNYHTLVLSGKQLSDRPLYANRVPISFNSIYSDDYLKLYTGGTLRDLLSIEEHQYMSSRYGVDSRDSNWIIAVDNKMIESNMDVRSKAEVVEKAGYSSLFSIDLADLYSDSVFVFSIDASVTARSSNSGDAHLVISVEEGSEVLYWAAKEMNFSGSDTKYPITFSEKWDVPRDLNHLSVLRVYVWNSGGEEVIIENFEVNIVHFK